MKKRCPHSNIVDCPLYHAAHEADMPYGCDDGDWASGCAVARGLDYQTQIAAMRMSHPGYVEQIEWNADLRERKAQQRRNMRALRLH